VADLHLRAMTQAAAAGERFLAVAGDFLEFNEIAAILKKNLGVAAKKVPTRVLPNFLVRIAALFDPAIKVILPELGKKKNGTSAKRCECWVEAAVGGGVDSGYGTELVEVGGVGAIRFAGKPDQRNRTGQKIAFSTRTFASKPRPSS